jgi:hypothetical protein
MMLSTFRPSTIDRHAVANHHDDDMKTRIKTRIAELLLLSFIVVFVARATPNLDMLPNIPWAEDRTTGDLENTDDKAWGNYARMKFMETHPAANTPTLKSVPERKFWLQRPRGIAV